MSGEDDPKLARLSTDEIIMLHAYRNLPIEYQEHLRDLAMAMHRHRLAQKPSNVVLLADPLRKFRRSIR